MRTRSSQRRKRAKQIKPGNRVFFGSACGEPQALMQAMTEAGAGLSDTEVVQVLTLGLAPYAARKVCRKFQSERLLYR